MTNQPHREWVYRAGHDLGRHVIGYEVQKVLAVGGLVRHAERRRKDLPVGVAGYGEGGLIAMYAAALDPRIDATLVSGYFDSRQNLARRAASTATSSGCWRSSATRRSPA